MRLQRECNIDASIGSASGPRPPGFDSRAGPKPDAVIPDPEPELKKVHF